MTEQQISTEVELLPCPFCGTIPNIYEAPNHAGAVLCWIECPNHKCPTSVSTWMDTLKNAVKFWNTRV